ncbi:GATOR complex protein NPRL3-like isoform X2 [Xenia sp. Carnegie-2017]|uniref:GATOR complex protein NPRL3-like isoform X2 n=1 Tax=Xenia sp. Carnegie-2017 TaxID=2897299 RepID=UPI001F040A00|nr:GATOR complex protein NPRL3-like isoform X2 [Xenia sp. Carnegie-2017]
MSLLQPVNIILVTAGSRGEKLLFRYPYNELMNHNDDENGSKSIASEKKLSYLDKTLANVLTPGEKLCGKKFELRIDDILFIGHPTLVSHNSFNQRNDIKVDVDDIKLFNIVFALQADVDYSICESYHDLSHKISTALKHEELRCGYFSSERQTMLEIHDEVSELPEANEISPFHLILSRSSLARTLCSTFCSVSETGMVDLKMNNWVRVGFCLPQKVHNFNSEFVIKPEAVLACLSAMRPYHTLLLLVDEISLSSLLPNDSSPDLIRFVKMSTPLKSFQTLSQDTDIPLSLIFSIAAHLVYWGKAKIIYPLCESNVYVVSPMASIHCQSEIAEHFSSEYIGMSLHDHLAQFSLPTPLGEHASPLWSVQQKTDQVQRVIWMLKHHLLLQLHMYISLIPEKSGVVDNNEVFSHCIDFDDPDAQKLFKRLCRYFNDMATVYDNNTSTFQ